MGPIIGVISAAGYAGIAGLMAIESACIPLPSEIIMPFAGYLVSLGQLNLIGVATMGAIGCNVGSTVAYYVAAKGGRPVFQRWGSYVLVSPADMARAEQFFERYGAITVFVGRLLPVVRTYISFPAGASDIRTGWFVVATVAGSIPWNVGLAYAGLKLGQNYPVVSRYLGPAVIPFAIIVVALLAAGWWFGRRLDSEEASQAA